MSRLDNIFNSDFFKESNKEIEQRAKDIWGEYTAEEKNIITEWNKKIGKDNALEKTVFRDASFLREFLKKVPSEEQLKYVENTYKYGLEDNCDHKYVIVTRRAIPSEQPKREGFWTSEHRTALSGLRREIPENSPERLHSVIMVSTLGKLEEHGIDKGMGPRSDGEIRIDASKPFSDFLFMYKPKKEKEKLKEYLENGGMTRKEVLEKRQEKSKERRRSYSNTYDVALNDLEKEESITTKLGRQVLSEMLDVIYEDETERDINEQTREKNDNEQTK